MFGIKTFGSPLPTHKRHRHILLYEEGGPRGSLDNFCTRHAKLQQRIVEAQIWRSEDVCDEVLLIVAIRNETSDRINKTISFDHYPSTNEIIKASIDACRGIPYIRNATYYIYIYKRGNMWAPGPRGVIKCIAGRWSICDE